MPVPKLEDLEGSIPNSRSQLLLQIRKELIIMLRKALTLGMVVILALSLLAVSMITCFTYEAEAEKEWYCENDNGCWFITEVKIEADGWTCVDHWHTH